MSFETKRILLTSAVNLSADPELGAAPNEPFEGFAFVQNSGAALVYWRESVDAPDPAVTGHRLATGDAVVVQLFTSLPFWVWSAEGEGEINVSGASPTPTI